MEESLTNERLRFRQLLDEYGLIELAGGELDGLEFLENEIIKLADSISKRERFLRLIEQARKSLNRQEEEQREAQQIGELPKCESREKPNPHTGRRFRRFTLCLRISE